MRQGWESGISGEMPLCAACEIPIIRKADTASFLCSLFSLIWKRQFERRGKREENKKKRQFSGWNCRFFLAESVRFELTVGLPITSFQDWLLKPLGQLSIGVQYNIFRETCQADGQLWNTKRPAKKRWIFAKKGLTKRGRACIMNPVAEVSNAKATRREHSSAGRAHALQAWGHRFEPCCSHHLIWPGGAVG